MAANAIGLSLATEKFGASWFRNGSRPGGVLTSPNIINDNQKAGYRRSWEEIHSGAANANRVAILDGGMDFKPYQIPPEDAQFLETRQFQVSEVARWFQIPPHLLGDLSRSTNNNIEHQSIEFVRYTLRPWLLRWEHRCRPLLGTSSNDLFLEHVTEALLRGDTAARYEAYTKARNWGWLSINDIRRLENLPPVKDGDA